jgi:hypothetical protein
MALIDGLFTKEDDLTAFDPDEAQDLPLHVRQCARRYASLSRRIDLLLKLALAILAVLILNNTIDVRAQVIHLLGGG